MNNGLLLLIDDNESMLINIKEYFSKKVSTLKIKSACTKSEAQKILDENKSKAKVCLIDFHLKNVNGAKLCKEFLKRYDNIEIIVYTGTQDEELKEQILNEGALTYVAGLIRPSELLLWVKTAFKRIENNFAFALDKLGDEVFICDKNNKIIFANSQFKKNHSDWVINQTVKDILGIDIGKQLNDKKDILVEGISGKYFVTPTITQYNDVTIIVLRNYHKRKVLNDILDILKTAISIDEAITFTLNAIKEMGFDRIRFYKYVELEKSRVLQGYKSIGMDNFPINKKGQKIDFEEFAIDLTKSRIFDLTYYLKTPIRWSIPKIKNILSKTYKYQDNEEKIKFENAFKKLKINAKHLYYWPKQLGFEDIKNNITNEIQKVIWIDIPLIVEDKRIATISIDNYHKIKNGNYYETQMKFENYSNEVLDIMSILSKHLALTIQRINLQEELINEKTLFENIMDSTRKHSIIGSDLDGNTIIWNKGAEDIFQYRKEEVLNKNTDELLFGFSRREEIIRKIEESVKGYYEEQYCKEIKKDGSKAVVTFIVQNLVDKNQKITGTIGIGREISSEIRLSQRLKESESMALIGTLSTGLAHQLRGPINGIKSSFKFLTTNLQNTLNNKHKTHIDIINNKIDFTIQTIDILTKYVRGTKLEAESIDIYHIISESLIIPSDILINITIKNHILENSFPHVFVEKTFIKNVFINLFVNAAQAIPSNGVIEISAEIKDSYIAVKISDNGPGIPEEIRDKIFLEIVSKKAIGSGTGLGLLQCYEYIRQNNGEINFSTSENGTTFIVKLPLVEVKNA